MSRLSEPQLPSNPESQVPSCVEPFLSSHPEAGLATSSEPQFSRASFALLTAQSTAPVSPGLVDISPVPVSWGPVKVSSVPELSVLARTEHRDPGRYPVSSCVGFTHEFLDQSLGCPCVDHHS